MTVAGHNPYTETNLQHTHTLVVVHYVYHLLDKASGARSRRGTACGGLPRKICNPHHRLAAKSSPDNFIILLPTLRELLPRDLKFMKRKGKENEDKLIKVLNHFFLHEIKINNSKFSPTTRT